MAVKSDKFTWIIGDIHGMYDALRLLIRHLDNDYTEKFIFLGDYIDHGPSSKEVLDLVMSLGDRAITLLGNHEQLLLDTLYNKTYREDYGTSTWVQNNGGLSTIQSFNYEDFEEFEAKLDTKYIDFLQNLKCFHLETLDCLDSRFKFLITHAGVMPTVPVETQMKINNYALLTKFLEENDIWIEDGFSWIRNGFLNGDPDHWQDYIIIHGHTPTHILKNYKVALPKNYDPALPFVRRHPESNNIVSINLDTGAAFGNRLTALGLLPNDINFSGGNHLSLYQTQLDIKSGYYRYSPIMEDMIRLEC